MLTVKHIIWDGGFETLYQAKQVRVKREEVQCAPTRFAPDPEFIAFDLPNGDVWKLDDGIVYVMNEAGRTVAKYEFASSRRAASGGGNTQPYDQTVTITAPPSAVATTFTA